ncbi:glycerol-3-phosphate dehydrogenase subunit GlpB [Halocatena pleomorpha]|uniref:Glycerol-3-phosphate dehydrogenase subunit GlpB n=1 Tax=Halocatena pleomorpha TaxID=1785090 RepID=A0A3P3RFF7_9EURY|nr:glycerol-3-phosphate dehydrogenase subunit GlpB [Halocatena pleomorpha]RRJ32162.1 glycerol-3-phosphate dehydrogenase subunit GlpB [Halocatena pleomorpha]
MAISDDVIVIGGGLAGSMSALSAAKAGASVRLISHKESTLRHASGLIDVLGYPTEGDQPVVNPFDALDELPDEHPYTVVGESGIREGLALFDEITGDLYAGTHTDRNALVPTQQGTVKPTARYPRSMAAGIGNDRETLLVGFESLPDFDAPLAADHLEAVNVPFASRGVTVPFPADLRVDAKYTRFATALEREETTAALAETVESHLDGAERVAFPALLGRDNDGSVRSSLESHLGVSVFELPGGPPSLPGLRLVDRLSEALDAAGVHRSTGVPVVGRETAGDRVSSVLVDRGNHTPHPYHASEFVLATGGLVGKGIDSDRNGVHEPIFDCHVPHPKDRYDWFCGDAFGDHPFARFGVVSDGELRPVDAQGTVEHENLRAAGSVLGGANIAAEKSGSGISLATGALAGRLAAEAI